MYKLWYCNVLLLFFFIFIVSFIILFYRGVLAVPFHMACTTYASCRLAQLIFKPVVVTASANNSSFSSSPSPSSLYYPLHGSSPPELVPFTSTDQTSCEDSGGVLAPIPCFATVGLA